MIAGLVGLCWTVVLISRSRSTPVVMLLQTVVAVFWFRRQKWLVLRLCALTVCAAIGVRFLVPNDVVEKWTDRFKETDLVGYFLGHPSHLGTSDEQREELQSRLSRDILSRPTGGFAAVNEEDPENLYLDLALQLGWAPALLFALLGKPRKPRPPAARACLRAGFWRDDPLRRDHRSELMQGQRRRRHHLHQRHLFGLCGLGSGVGPGAHARQ
jgi:hypothetical protein